MQLTVYVKHISLAAVAACLLTLLLGCLQILPLSPAVMALVILLMASILLITEPIPLAVGAMTVPPCLALTGVLSPSEAFSGFSNENVILFGSMFIVGGAMFRTGLAKTIGDLIVQRAGGNSRRLLIYIMLVTATFSSVMSNTGTVAVLLPVCMGIADSAGIERRYLLLPLAMTASLGGMITLIGCPPNMTASAILEEYCHTSIGFLEFAWAGIPVTLAGCLYLFITTKGKLPGRLNFPFAKASSPQFTKKQLSSAAVLLAVILIMATGTVNLALGASIGALACIILGLVTEKEAVEDIDWTTIFLFAGMLPLADALEKTGAGELIARQITRLMGEDASGFVILTFLYAACALLTQFMSNTAACSLLAPVAAQIALSVNADPKTALLIVAAGSSAAFATPMATPPNTLVMGPAKLGFPDFFRTGLALSVISYIICIVVIPWIYPFFPN